MASYVLPTASFEAETFETWFGRVCGRRSLEARSWSLQPCRHIRCWHNDVYTT